MNKQELVFVQCCSPLLRTLDSRDKAFCINEGKSQAFWHLKALCETGNTIDEPGTPPPVLLAPTYGDLRYPQEREL